MLRGLLYIATMFDEKGYSKYADMIDDIATNYVKTAVARPVVEFAEDLKKGFANAAASESSFPTITDKSLNDLYRVIDIVLEHGRAYNAPGMSNLGDFIQEAEEGLRPLAEGFVELENSIVKLMRQQRQETDPAKLKELEAELRKENSTYGKLLERAERLKNDPSGEGQEKYNKFMTMLEQLRKERGVQ